MAVNTIATALRTTLADAFVDAIDQGSGAGKMKFYTSAFGALVVTLTFNDPAFGAAVNGVATCDVDPAVTGTVGANADGTIAVGRITDSDDTVLWQFACGTSGSDANLTNLTLAESDTLTLTSFTFTYPAS